MKKEKLYNEFEDLATRIGLRIIRGKGDFNGGPCIINNEKVIVLNKIKPLEQRLRVLASSFNEINLEDVYIVPALRAFIQDSNTLDF
ncbi:MAG: hypothetical protein CMG55_00315 [Candidatus Marinimicrobia bacterium]|nr:hypothetical protein [Candidatus Neomarinimicrobiota bacterium]|tara:strand:+ start:1726 stop:1986 length:261 start_codon:yes stop_codon:yes gene_type:complete